MNMHLKVIIFSMSFLTTSAFPLHSNSGEATWTDSKANQAHDKTELTKDEDKIYKNHIDSKGLYSQEDEDNKNPVTEEVQHKLNMESDRLRSRLRQELAELRERLSPSPVHFSSTLESMRERLAPLTQQLQSSLSSNTQDMCGQLSLYLQGLETAEAQAETSPPLYHEAVSWMGQTMERLFQGLEENLKVQGASSLSSIQPGDSLHEDFSVKFSALIQDILQSVQ